MTEAPRHPNFFKDPPAGFAEATRYGLAMAAVLAAFAALGVCFGNVQPSQDAAEVDSAVMVDLPPFEASARPLNDTEEGPEQQAAQASVAQPTPEKIQPPKPVIQPNPAETPSPIEEPPLIEPKPPVVLQQKKEEETPPFPVASPSTPPQDERAPEGSAAPTPNAAEEGEEAAPHASARAITVWQKSLMKRLEVAKRFFSYDKHGGGTVEIAFDIDATGSLRSERVAVSSGSSRLDGVALTLVRRAAPFPEPPPHASAQDMSFIVPIRFE